MLYSLPLIDWLKLFTNYYSFSSNSILKAYLGTSGSTSDNSNSRSRSTFILGPHPCSVSLSAKIYLLDLICSVSAPNKYYRYADAKTFRLSFILNALTPTLHNVLSQIIFTFNFCPK